MFSILGNISTFSPVTLMDRSGITLIRPLIYANEKEIKSFVKKSNIKTMDKCCPMDGFSKREDMKNLVTELSITIPGIETNLFGAIKRSNMQGWTNNNVL